MLLWTNIFVLSFILFVILIQMHERFRRFHIWFRLISIVYIVIMNVVAILVPFLHLQHSRRHLILYRDKLSSSESLDVWRTLKEKQMEALKLIISIQLNSSSCKAKLVSAFESKSGSFLKFFCTFSICWHCIIIIYNDVDWSNLY